MKRKITKFENKISIQHIQALLEGKKMVFSYPDAEIEFILYPDRYGVFMTHEKFLELRRKIGFQMLADTDGFFKEILGEDMFERFSKNSNE